MIAGRLTEKIVILKPTITVNEVGEQETTYQEERTTRAELLLNGGNRNISNDEISFSYNKTFNVRIYIDLDEFCRIKWNGKYYRILSIETDKENQYKTIYTELINE